MHQENILGPQTIATQTSLRQRARCLLNPHCSHAHSQWPRWWIPGSSHWFYKSKPICWVTRRSQASWENTFFARSGREISAVWENQSPGSDWETANSKQEALATKSSSRGECLHDVGIYWSLLTQSKANRDLLHQFGSFQSTATTLWLHSLKLIKTDGSHMIYFSDRAHVSILPKKQ